MDSGPGWRLRRSKFCYQDERRAVVVTSCQLSLTRPTVMTRLLLVSLLLLSLQLPVTPHLSPLTHQEVDTDYRYHRIRETLDIIAGCWLCMAGWERNSMAVIWAFVTSPSHQY